jgi:hypothetical protein
MQQGYTKFNGIFAYKRAFSGSIGIISYHIVTKKVKNFFIMLHELISAGIIIWPALCGENQNSGNFHWF